MKDGTRTMIFKYLLKNIPEGTNKMNGKCISVTDEIEKLFVEKYEEDAIKEVLKTFSKGWDENGNKTFYSSLDEFLDDLRKRNSKLFKSREDAIQWGAEHVANTEYWESLQWLLDNGYIREWKKPARFGYIHYIGITSKGWKVAHLYR